MIVSGGNARNAHMKPITMGKTRQEKPENILARQAAPSQTGSETRKEPPQHTVTIETIPDSLESNESGSQWLRMERA
jgi:hypothetical protein